jgi:hypothetical protein
MGPDARTKADVGAIILWAVCVVIHSEDTDIFIVRLVTADESWFHYDAPEKVP